MAFTSIKPKVHTLGQDGLKRVTEAHVIFVGWKGRDRNLILLRLSLLIAKTVQTHKEFQRKSVGFT